jgi:DNA-binding XRE family transcriptional regulator
MAKRRKTSDAVEILRNRYVEEDPERKASVEAERVNAEAQMIHDLRIEAGLTRAELADLVGTTQSVISRLEDADYEGHSLTMLNRIARALNKKMTVVMRGADPEAG